MNKFATTYQACMNKVAELVKSAEDTQWQYPQVADECRKMRNYQISQLPKELGTSMKRWFTDPKANLRAAGKELAAETRDAGRLYKALWNDAKTVGKKIIGSQPSTGAGVIQAMPGALRPDWAAVVDAAGRTK